MGPDRSVGLGTWTRRKTMALLRRLRRWGRGRSGPIVGEVTICGRTWRVEVVETRRDRYVGLSGRAEVPAGTGMLFVYPQAYPQEYSMRGCLVPLDIAFLSPSLEVLAVHTMEVEPDRAGRKQYLSGAPAQYVLEVGGGELARAGVAVGGRALLSANIPAPIWAEPWP